MPIFAQGQVLQLIIYFSLLQAVLALADFDVTEIGGTPTGTTYTGFTIGGGVDYGFSDNLVGRLEYLHDEFGKESYTDGVDNYTADLSDDIVRAVLVYRLGH